MTLDTILEAIKKAETIVILTHEIPDGDAVGSSLSLAIALEKINKKVDIIIPDYPQIFNFLPEIDKIKNKTDIENYDLAIALDCADSKFLCGYKKYFGNAKTKIVIDHHSSNTMYGDINFVNPAMPACCQVLIAMFQYFKIEINKELATCIITGIITDTGGFCYGTTAETFEFAADISRLGVNISEIFKYALKIKSREAFELNKIATNRLEYLEDGKITFTYITEEDIIKVNAKQGDHEGIVDIGKNIENVEVSIFLHAVPEKGYKLSLRSVERVDVSKIATVFGGGGHKKAAGAYIKGDIEQIKKRVIQEVEKQFIGTKTKV